MTDRELLELAAKAAGYELLWYVGRDGMDIPRSWAGGREWSPLADDGDAMRLAVKLKIDIVQVHNHVTAYHHNTKNITTAYVDVSQREDFGGNPYAATRLAIVRAAVEIGKLNDKRTTKTGA